MAIVAVALVCLHGGPLMALEKPDYEVLESRGDFELRRYGPLIVAETYVDGDFGDAGNQGFRRLADYIFGNNRSRRGVDGTEPGSQPTSEKIAMTAPVNMHKSGEQYRVTFMMPSDYTLESLPVPVNPQVRLREVPGELVAAVRYSGTWSERRYVEHRAQLEAWVQERGWESTGQAVFARYDPPIVPWFLRRNEILLPVAQDPAPPIDEGEVAP
jgi:hypothetical protein